jgi:hypothetical protein
MVDSFFLWRCCLMFPLAQGRLVDMGNQFRTGRSALDSQQWPVFLLALTLLILAVAAVSRYFNARESRGYSSCRGLYRELCRAHDVNWRERRLMSAVARRLGLPHPVFLFTDPQQLEPAKLPVALHRRQVELAALSQRLFHSTDEPDDQGARPVS